MAASRLRRARFVLQVVLGSSRLLHAEFVARQTALIVMPGPERALQAFGGVPKHVPFDQTKSVIVEDHQPGGGRFLENPELAASRQLDREVARATPHVEHGPRWRVLVDREKAGLPTPNIPGWRVAVDGIEERKRVGPNRLMDAGARCGPAAARRRHGPSTTI